MDNILSCILGLGSNFMKLDIFFSYLASYCLWSWDFPQLVANAPSLYLFIYFQLFSNFFINLFR